MLFHMYKILIFVRAYLHFPCIFCSCNQEIQRFASVPPIIHAKHRSFPANFPRIWPSAFARQRACCTARRTGRMGAVGAAARASAAQTDFKDARGQGGTGTGSEVGEGATAVRERHPHLAGAGHSVENDEENAEIPHFLCLFDRRGTTVRKSLSCHVTSCHVTHHAKSYFLYSFSSIVE